MRQKNKPYIDCFCTLHLPYTLSPGSHLGSREQGLLTHLGVHAKPIMMHCAEETLNKNLVNS